MNWTMPLFKRTFDYGGFVNELRSLIERGKKLEFVASVYNQDGFVGWHHAVNDALRRVTALGYDVNTKFNSRNFRSDDPDFTKRWKVYQGDLKNTISELEHVVNLYDRYGAPQRRTTVTTRSPMLATPPQVIGEPPETHTTVQQPKDVLQHQKPVTQQAKTTLLEKPENITLPWLWNHMSLRGWAGVITVLAAVFGLGVTAAKYLPLK